MVAASAPEDRGISTESELAMNKNQDKWILYSTCDEDSTSELRALDIQPGDDVLSVTGSGCRTLSLLTRNPQKVTSVDYSSGQNHLLELKLAAIRNLDYDTLLAFLGVDPCRDRWGLFGRIEKDLSPAAAAYFRRYRKAIERGVLFAGRHELFYLRFVAPLMKLIYGRHLKRIFSTYSIADQRKIYRERVDGPLWRWLVKYGFSETTIRLILNDKRYRISIDVASVGEYVLERLDHTFSHHLARGNHWVSLMLNGRYIDRDALPHFLLRDSYDAIRAAKTELRIVTANLLEHVDTIPDASIDKFSLSDVTSCVDTAQFNRLLRGVGRTARSGARLCYRNFLAKHTVADDVRPLLRRDDQLCASLDRDDLAFVYSFEVATIPGKMGEVIHA
jgi:S-adenosylmethionine-diacylglycerol 3-amino-3-carboxypropyl transferase